MLYFVDNLDFQGKAEAIKSSPQILSNGNGSPAAKFHIVGTFPTGDSLRPSNSQPLYRSCRQQCVIGCFYKHLIRNHNCTTHRLHNLQVRIL